MKKIIIGMMILVLMLSSCANRQTCSCMNKNDSSVFDLKGEDVVEGLNDFAFEMYNTMNLNDPVNEFYSPLSISAAFAMTYAGAKHKTATEMMEVMNYGLQNERFHKTYGKMLDSLASENNEDFEMNIANAIWVQNNFKLLKDYKEIVTKDYHSETRLLDFVHGAQAARKVINNWVENKTNDRIKDLIPEGVLDADTRMVLTNAVYFNAEWANMFNENMTRKDVFYLLDGTQTSCDMMYQHHHYLYSKTMSAEILEIPYKGYDYSMLIVLPRTKTGLKQSAKTIDIGVLEEHDKSKKSEDILLYMPKFKLETDYQLQALLKEMGIEQAFTNFADFSGITGGKDLFISDVIHKAFIEVDEKKTEAAAATALVMKLTSMAPVQKAPIEFRADHPFTFMIRHNESKAIVFMGQLTLPEAE